jgi:hypothetical protein
MKTKLLTLMLLVGGSLFAQSRFSVRVGIGVPVITLHPGLPTLRSLVLALTTRGWREIPYPLGQR